jgi:hypothetical protein
MPTRRRSTGKRLRFEVFKRDHFTCQYCGAQPPEIVLVVDHIVPVASGGETTLENLLSACEPCNQGKADRALEQRTIRPDADLLYLETQQEIAELRRFQAAKAERDAELARVVELLQHDWAALSGLEWHPADRIVRNLLATYSPEIVEAAMSDVAVKVGDGYLPAAGDRWVPYLYSVARTMAREHEDEVEA